MPTIVAPPSIVKCIGDSISSGGGEFALTAQIFINAARYIPKSLTPRSENQLQALVHPGVSYQKFGESLQNFSIEIALAKDKLGSDKERKLAKI